jgi:hypothetical protein
MPSAQVAPHVWMTLEVVKIVVAALTPVAVAVLGWLLSRQMKRVEALQWSNQKLIEKRLEVYSALAPLLNDLYCYFDYIGDWKMKDPPAVLSLKRSIDRLVYVNAPLFSAQFRQAYADFIDFHFVPGPREADASTAKIRSDASRRKKLFRERGEAWDPSWDDYFVAPAEAPDPHRFMPAYWTMMDAFARELAVDLARPGSS